MNDPTSGGSTTQLTFSEEDKSLFLPCAHDKMVGDKPAPLDYSKFRSYKNRMTNNCVIPIDLLAVIVDYLDDPGDADSVLLSSTCHTSRLQSENAVANIVCLYRSLEHMHRLDTWLGETVTRIREHLLPNSNHDDRGMKCRISAPRPKDRARVHRLGDVIGLHTRRSGTTVSYARPDKFWKWGCKASCRCSKCTLYECPLAPEDAKHRSKWDVAHLTRFDSVCVSLHPLPLTKRNRLERKKTSSCLR